VSVRLVARGVKKAFGATVALADVSLEAQAGEVHAVLGENGAGKSTLMHVLSGVLRLDDGEMRLDDAPYAPRTPAAAARAGVSLVSQEHALCTHMTVAENLSLGAEPSRYGFVARRARDEAARASLARVTGTGRPIALETRALDLTPADQQKVEIARALLVRESGRAGQGSGERGGGVLILDEPTSSLGADDVERLFHLLDALKERGTTVLYISHFLEEVRRVADRYTVLRDGRTVDAGRMGDVSDAELVARMAGRSVDHVFVRERGPEVALREVVLSVRGLSSGRVREASFDLRRGEVLGLAGLVGAGRTEILRAIYGLEPVRAGRIRVLRVDGVADGAVAGTVEGAARPRWRIAQGIGMVSEDRKGEGLALTRSIAENATLSSLSELTRGGLLSERRQHAAAAGLIARLRIRARGPEQVVGDLSGGNQQKVAVARLLHQRADVLLLDEPTRGIDVGAKAEIFRLVDERVREGAAVLFVSSYLPELMGLCDRIAVVRRGVLGEARPVSAWTENELLAEAAGALAGGASGQSPEALA
jgi:ribose transport system ATP-binding protein